MGQDNLINLPDFCKMWRIFVEWIFPGTSTGRYFSRIQGSYPTGEMLCLQISTRNG